MAIIHDIPKHKYFPYAAPFPEKSNRFELLDENPELDFILDGKEIKAKLVDYIDYQVKHISDYHAFWAYGKNGKELAKQLLNQYPQLNPDSRIVIYLFEII